MFEFKLPDLGEGVHEGQIVNVLVQEGDVVAEYQPLLEVETDKAAVEIPSPKAGRIAKLLVEPGQVIKVGDVMVVIDEKLLCRSCMIVGTSTILKPHRLSSTIASGSG